MEDDTKYTVTEGVTLLNPLNMDADKSYEDYMKY